MVNEFNIKDACEKMRDGDKNAFVSIYNELKKPVFTIIYRIVQSKEIAEDITQDVFIKLLISPPHSSIKNPRAWIFQIARNLAIDAIRKHTNVNIEDRECVTEDDTETLITVIDIESAIRRLPCIEREIISLHLNCEFTFTETARLVGLSTQTTYRKYRKALKTLRNLLNGGIL